MLVTVQQLKSFLGKSENDQDALLTLIAEGVSATIERALGETVIATASVTEVVKGNGYATISVSQRIRTVVSVTEVDAALTSSDYRIQAPRNLERVSNGLSISWAHGDVTVVYMPGYTAVPHDLRHAALVQSAFEYAQTKDGGNRIGLSSNAPGGEGESVSYLTHDLLPEVQRIVANRRVW